MRNLFLIGGLFLLVTITNAQKQDSIKMLSAKWKADSNGTLGIRKNCVERVHGWVDVFGLSIVGDSKNQVVSLLGKPTMIGKTSPLIGNDFFDAYYYILEITGESKRYLVVNMNKESVTTTSFEYITDAVKVK